MTFSEPLIMLSPFVSQCLFCVSCFDNNMLVALVCFNCHLNTSAAVALLALISEQDGLFWGKEPLIMALPFVTRCPFRVSSLDNSLAALVCFNWHLYTSAAVALLPLICEQEPLIMALPFVTRCPFRVSCCRKTPITSEHSWVVKKTHTNHLCSY